MGKLMNSLKGCSKSNFAQKIQLLLAASTLCIGTAVASGSEQHLLHAHVDLANKGSLQRGAKLYVNYCSGCHSLKYLRYSQLAQGLELLTYDGQIDKHLLHNNLVFTSAQVGDPVKISMPPTDAREWFGKVPPDLSLVARVRGADWLYTYLKSFYQDNEKPFGANNWIFPDVAMPNVLAPLQGIQQPVYETKTFVFDGQEKTEEVIARLTTTEDGEMSEHQFDAAVNDIVSFLAYVGEPVKQKREWLGIWVLLFVFSFTLLLYALKKSYWSEIKK
jgi:ubiquinol-cytochrome c reductase cytochrome c1 subunit